MYNKSATVLIWTSKGAISLETEISRSIRVSYKFSCIKQIISDVHSGYGGHSGPFQSIPVHSGPFLLLYAPALSQAGSIFQIHPGQT